MSVSEPMRAFTGMLMMAAVSSVGATPSSAAAATDIGTGRLVPIISMAVGLIGVALGWRALSRSTHGATGNGRRQATMAAMAGLTSVVVGGLHWANAAGGVGTGNGLAGAIVSIVLGAIGMTLGGVVLARFRRTV